MPDRFGKVAVMMGGTAAERPVSLVSGAAVLKALQDAGVNAHGVDWDGGVPTHLVEEKFDRVFNVVHGRGGEDGRLQALLETLNLPYTGSGVLGSALSMDKVQTKKVWSGMQLPTPKFVSPTSTPDAEAVVAELGLPLMVKPAHEGSSFGASKVERIEDLVPAWKHAREYDDGVVIEQWITGGEYTVGILGDEVLPLIKLETPHTFYDYEAKYEEDTTQYLCPCGLDADHEAQIQALAWQAFRAVDCSGWGRVDVMLNEAGDPFFIEVNTVPGMTSHSLVPMAAKQRGVDFQALVVQILESTL